jgi:diacylglycerol kinase family enzyme
MLTVRPARHPVLFINPRSGGGKAERARLPDVARERGIEPLILEPGRGIEELIEDGAADAADVLGVAGGDGSLSIVASAAAARGLPFVCIPAGTRNHFARDVGVAPSDLVGALDAFGAALERTIDMGDVNGRPFLNNVSVGVYGEAVQRAGYRDAKLRTLLEAARQVLGPNAEPGDLHLTDDRGRSHEGPAAVLVSNNPYVFGGPPTAGARPALDSGELGILVVDALEGRPHQPIRAWSARSVRVEASRAVPAGIDGEAGTLEVPLELTVRPRALRVRLAPRHVNRSGRQRGGAH